MSGRPASLVAAATLAACHGSSSNSPSPPGVAPAATAPTVTAGHLNGYADIAGVRHFADGLLTHDGDLRLHILRGDELNIYESFQFIGSFGPPGRQVAGQGTIIGQFCSGQTPSKFCGTATAANIMLVGGGAPPETTAIGELSVPTETGTEVWPLHLGYWGSAHFNTTYELPRLRGLYRERLAEFSPTYEAIIDVDPTGRLFFQDAATGCTGNGTLVSASDRTPVYVVSLTITGCRSPTAVLNADFDGFATFEPPFPWEYAGHGPRMWLSTRAGSPRPAALATDAAGF